MANDKRGPKNSENTSALPDTASQNCNNSLTGDDEDDWGESESREGSGGSYDPAASSELDESTAVKSQPSELTSDDEGRGESKPRDGDDSSRDTAAGTSEKPETDLDLDDRADYVDLDAADFDDGAATMARSKTRKTQPKPRRKIVKPRSGKNATKHGAFAHDVLLPDESEEDWRHLSQALIDEWQPGGETVKQLVGTLTRNFWYQRRVDRFGRHELLLALESPMERELNTIQHVAVLLEHATNEASVQRHIGVLRENYKLYLDREFPRAKYKDFWTWLDALQTSAMPTILEVHRNAVLFERQNFEFQTEQAERLRAKFEQILTLHERTESRTYKTIKALVQFKFWQSSAIPRNPGAP